MWYKNIRAQNFLVLLLTLTGVAGTYYYLNQDIDLNSDQKHNIDVAVFTEVFNFIKSHPAEDPGYFFIGVSGEDPRGNLLKHFEGFDPRVEPKSLSMMTFGLSSKVRHKKDPSKQGMIVDLLSRERHPDGSVKVLVSIYQERGISGIYDFTLKRINGFYQVTLVRQAENN